MTEKRKREERKENGGLILENLQRRFGIRSKTEALNEDHNFVKRAKEQKRRRMLIARWGGTEK